MQAEKDKVISGMKGLKQIARTLHRVTNKTPEEKEEIFSKHSFNFLNRHFPDWIKESKR